MLTEDRGIKSLYENYKKLNLFEKNKSNVFSFII